MLYLHETIRIRGEGSEGYLRAVQERARHSAEQGISRLLGAWRVIGSTGRWPRAVNLWEMDGWEHWAASLERQFLPERKDPHLAPWWRDMLRYRSGGFDRILEALPGSLDYATLVASGRRAWVVEQTIFLCAPGSECSVIEEAIEAERRQREAEKMWLLGAYKAPLRPGEGLLLWAAPTFAVLCRWWERSSRNPWWQRLRQLEARAEVCWLVPAEGSLLDPRR